jgi:hypothetical protein
MSFKDFPGARTFEKCDPCWHGRHRRGASIRRFRHHDEPGCWCAPKKKYTDPVTATEVWVHRYADD